MSRSLSRALVLAALTATFPAAVRAQTAATITGRVAGEQGQPLTAASVFIPSLNYGTTTRNDGTYTFTVPASRVSGQTVAITARLVGYRAQTAQITLRAGTISQDFTLPTAPAQLSAVVVTGAGTVSTRERLGNVINSVDSTTIRRAAAPQNIVSALAGKAPNVEIRTQSGEPGASASIKIRGASSVLGTNQPLFVVDGQPIDNTTLSTNGGNQSTVTQNRAADINPNDIESIEILKSAAAAAIYGASAANGVVLITTKRGRAGTTTYTLNSTNTFDHVQDKDILQQSFGQGSGGAAATCAALNCRPDRRSWGPALAGAPTFDHVTDIFDTGTTFDEHLDVSGGNERTLFFVSGGMTRQNGYMVGPNNFLNRTTVRLKASHRLFNSLNVGGNFNYVDERGGFVQKGSNISGLLLGSLRTPPEFDNRAYLDSTYHLHRSFRFPRPGANSLTATRGYDNPYFVLNNSGNRQELGRFIGNLNLDWRPLEWLRVQETLGADNYDDDRREALPLTSSGQPDGAVTRFTQTNLQIDHNLLVTASYTVSPSFSGTVSVGQNLDSRRYRSVFINGITLNAPEPLSIQNTLSYSPIEFRSLQHIAGYFGQATADLWNQLYLTALLRNDGYSTFGSSKRFALFPSASVAWAFTNALGNDQQRGAFSYGKLRFGYGQTGREPPVYATISSFSTGSVANNEGFGSGYGDLINASQSGQGGLVTFFQLGNSALKPERSTERELGADLGFFDQRVTLGATYYNKRSTDVILSLPVNAGQTGSTRALRNAATISNKGVELELTAHLYQSKSLGLDLGAQFGRNRGRVERLAEGTEFVPYNLEGFTGAIGSSTVGYAPGVIRGLDFARCGRGLAIEGVGNIDALCGANAKKDALFLNTDGLPVPDPTDRVIADPNPKWTAGFTPQLRISRLTLSGFLDVRRGGEVWNGTKGILYYFGTHKDTEMRSQTGAYGVNWQTKRYPDVAGPGVGVTPFKTANDWQSWLNNEGGGFGTVSGQFIESGSFVKLRELSLAYNADQPWVRRALGVSSVNVRLAARNLATWTNYTGFDPEANLGGAEFLTQGIDYFNNPMSRSFVLAFTVNR